ncbi:hypothetical protein HNR65_002166 [Desulfosalsimonas propionicica]|uniref:Uncharacterized protein n=1 Tax=Desulfosalsimonas propionicica TaxID=332175 RepID=A0A7W0C9V6_9BACT|nr:hypothetical protein [Desulfosalsimonas propionicica]MBA2881835.1 hypothetical protein [Desulfosalsimonas propionicica]
MEKSLRAESKRQKRALSTAVKVEGYRLRKQLIAEIRAGAPGGDSFAPLSMIQRKRALRTKPVAPLTKAIRYHIPSQDPIEMQIGWTGPKVSKSWKRIAKKQQEGYTVSVSAKQRRFLARYGGSMGRSKYKPFFFVQKSTRQFEVPARPIMEPFWAQNQARATKNITRNYQKKLRGERI